MDAAREVSAARRLTDVAVSSARPVLAAKAVDAASCPRRSSVRVDAWAATVAWEASVAAVAEERSPRVCDSDTWPAAVPAARDAAATSMSARSAPSTLRVVWVAAAATEATEAARSDVLRDWETMAVEAESAREKATLTSPRRVVSRSTEDWLNDSMVVCSVERFEVCVMMVALSIVSMLEREKVDDPTEAASVFWDDCSSFAVLSCLEFCWRAKAAITIATIIATKIATPTNKQVRFVRRSSEDFFTSSPSYTTWPFGGKA
jgi:hypothetical protein